jgi:hypothetical protein
VIARPLKPGSFYALKEWIHENRPDLSARLGPLALHQVQDVLEEETGLGLPRSISIDEGSTKYLEALKAKHADK